jgi:hypothetical protein
LAQSGPRGSLFVLYFSKRHARIALNIVLFQMSESGPKPTERLRRVRTPALLIFVMGWQREWMPSC